MIKYIKIFFCTYPREMETNCEMAQKIQNIYIQSKCEIFLIFVLNWFHSHL